MRIGELGVGSVVGLLMLAGCGAGGADTRPRGGGLASASASADGPVASASASATPAGTPPTANVSAFGFVVTTEQPIELFQVDDAAFAIAQQYFQPQVYKIDDTTVTEQPDLFKTLKVETRADEPTNRYFRIDAMRGRASGELEVTYNQPGERGGTTADAHLRNGAWVSDPPYPYAGDCWGGHCTPLDEANLIEQDGVFELYPRYFMMPKPKGWVPVATKAGAAAGCAARMGKYTQIGVDGDWVYGIGFECKGKDAVAEVLSIEMWKKGAAASAFFELPGKRTFRMDFMVETRRVEGALWLFGNGDEQFPSPYVARFDGKAWSDLSPGSGTGARTFVEAGAQKQPYLFVHDVGFRRDGEKWTALAFPKRTGVESAYGDRFVPAPDGSMWAVLDGKLYRVPADGKVFESVVLPSAPDTTGTGSQDLVAVDVRFTPNGDPVVAAFGDKHYVLVPTKRAPSKPMVAATPKSKVAFGDVKPATASCTKPFVVLYGMTKMAPDDYDFPLTRKALKGKSKYKETRFWVTRDAGQRFLIARTATVELGKDLVKDISASVKDSKPQLLCGDPAETIRELKIDLVTGDVVK